MHSNTDVQKVLANFILVKTGFDNPEVKDMAVKFIPTMVFYDAAVSREVGRHVGFLKAEQLIIYLNNMLAQAKS